MKQFKGKSVLGALLAAMLVAMPSAAQDNEDAQPSEQAIMQSRMAQNVQNCMMMMQSMGGRMMNKMPGPGMMQDSMRTGGMMGMMRGQGMRGMMDEMGMQNPMHRSMMLVHVLPSMQEPLHLSEAQVAQLAEAEESLMEAHARTRENLMTSQERLHALMVQENADPDEVGALMKRIAEQRAEMHLATFAAAQEMKEMLTAEQRSDLEDMGAARMHQHMMQNMSMMQMMQMMQKMHGNPAGASGSMMQPGSM